jgi:hypothetical protein
MEYVLRMIIFFWVLTMCSAVQKYQVFLKNLLTALMTDVTRCSKMLVPIYRRANWSLARPGRKHATAIKLQLLQATQKRFRRLSVQPGLRSSNDLRVGRKMATLQLFFSWFGLRTYQHSCTIPVTLCIYPNIG